MKFVQKMYSLFLWYIFKTAAIKKSLYGFKAYPCPNILIPLAKWTIYASILVYLYHILLLKKYIDPLSLRLFKRRG
jgi:hypothetical protein